MKNNNLVVLVVVAVIVGAAAFFGGMKYQASKTVPANGFANFAQGNGFRTGANGQRLRNGNRNGFGGATTGEIVSMDATSITVKLQDGSSKIINLSNATTYSKTDTASKSDLKTGERIAAFGTANSDGSISAQNIQLNPMFSNGPRPSGMEPSGTVPSVTTQPS
jgi:hypothetical protein